jgi:hypothetical protein
MIISNQSIFKQIFFQIRYNYAFMDALIIIIIKCFNEYNYAFLEIAFSI